MTREIYSDTEFETNGDKSRFQINFNPDSWFEDDVAQLRDSLIYHGFPVIKPTIPEPMSIVFSTTALKKQENKQ